MPAVRGRFWLWGHEAGSHNTGWGLPKPSRMTPTEAADHMGIPNVVMVVYGGNPKPPFDPHALALRPLKRVVWSMIGDSSSTRNDEKTDLDEVIGLSARHPNIVGAIMDDFFHEPDANGAVSRYGVGALEEFASRLHGAAHRLDLWVVLYQQQLELPIREHLAHCDVITFWTWHSKHLPRLESNFDALCDLAPGKRKVLGCYMWGYGDREPIPLELMRHQCRLGLQWLKGGRIEGMILLSSCVCDLGLEAVEWTREWIAQVGDTELT